ncbi:MAG: OmpA family protein [Prevotellaceae bacterium]|nr:OmpA family protein [Prevotellaceae bacterium]
MKHTVLSRAFALMVGIMFSHVACAQQVNQETDLTVYDEQDVSALESYLKTSYCPHEISVWGAGGVSSLQFRPTFGKANSNSGGSFGVGYTYFLSRNWGLSSGLEYAFYQSKTGLNGFSNAYETSDILNNPITYNTRIDHYSEKQFAGLLNIPLSVLYQTNGNHKFYASAGLKLGLPVSARYSGSNAVLTASGYYPSYDQTEIWQNDLGYGVFNPDGRKGKLDLGVSVMGTLESGVKWNTGIGNALYTGVFVDYGFNNVLKSGFTKKPLVEYNHTTPEYPVMNTACVLADRFAPLSFGIKVKLAFSVGCRDLLNDRRAYKNMQSGGDFNDDFFDFDNTVRQAETAKADTAAIINPPAIVPPVVVPLDTVQLETQDLAAIHTEYERKAYLEAAMERRRKYSQSISASNIRSMGNYNLGIVTLTGEQKAALDNYADVLLKNSQSSLEITGHTCDLGTDGLNLRIGQERADLAKDYLVEKGVAPSRISTFTKGESEPLFPNTNEVNRRKNRRIEIKIRE